MWHRRTKSCYTTSALSFNHRRQNMPQKFFPQLGKVLCTDDKFFCRRPISISMTKNIYIERSALTPILALTLWPAYVQCRIDYSFRRIFHMPKLGCIVPTNTYMNFLFCGCLDEKSKVDIAKNWSFSFIFMWLNTEKMMYSLFIQIIKLFTVLFLCNLWVSIPRTVLHPELIYWIWNILQKNE